MTLEERRTCYPRLSEAAVNNKQITLDNTSNDSNIDYLDNLPSYEQFFLRYLMPNRPCIISPIATRGWRSRNEWVTEHGSPNFDFLVENFGLTSVPVANCGEEKFSAHPKSEMLLRDYIQYWREFIHSGHNGDRLLYLKDWHFARTFPDYWAYKTPVYFCSDWLNEFWDCRTDEGDDYRFVYMGPKGTWTPLHADVLRSYSWSANICGRKKWIFFPPGEEKCLTDIHGQLAFSVDSKELSDSSRYPYYDQLQHQLEVIQEEGEIIFVPSGWHHQVFNMEDTISINHNWMNGCNILRCWDYMRECLGAVEREIDDCRDMDGWHSQCQLILKASAGIDYIHFIRFLVTIARHRLQALADHRAKSHEYSQKVHEHHNTDKTCASRKDTSESHNTEVDADNPGGSICQEFSKSETICELLCNFEQDLSTCRNHLRKEELSELQLNPSELGETENGSSLNFDVLCKVKDNVDTDDNRDTNSVKCKSITDSLSDVLDLSVNEFGSKDSVHQYIHWTRCNVPHAVFDLLRVRGVLSQILKTPVITEINSQTEVIAARTVLEEINKVYS